jgi:hypothetical protein
MPDSCDNLLKVLGPHDDLVAFVEKAECMTHRTHLCFHSLLPMPEELDISRRYSDVHPGSPPALALEARRAENLEKHGYADRYDWWLRKLSADRDLNMVKRSDLQGPDAEAGWSLISYNFRSAWVPPASAFQHVSRDFPTLIFMLAYEVHCHFGGSLVAARGGLVHVTKRPSPEPCYSCEHLRDASDSYPEFALTLGQRAMVADRLPLENGGQG